MFLDDPSKASRNGSSENMEERLVFVEALDSNIDGVGDCLEVDQKIADGF